MTSKFLNALKREPDKRAIKINKFAENAEYLPIGEVENTLDGLFGLNWETHNFRWQVVANEIVGSIDLTITLPSGQRVTRTGAAAVMIQVKKGAAIEVNNKIPNTLVKDFPHLKSECIKNAAKSLGRLLGRDLNRDEVVGVDLSVDFQLLADEAMTLLQNSTIDEGKKKLLEQRIQRVNITDLPRVIDYLKKYSHDEKK